MFIRNRNEKLFCDVIKVVTVFVTSQLPYLSKNIHSPLTVTLHLNELPDFRTAYKHVLIPSYSIQVI